MHYNPIELLTVLKTDKYISSNEIAEKLNISNRTVQTRMKELKEELAKNGVAIDSKQNKGYCIQIIDVEKYNEWRKTLVKDKRRHIPNSVEERFYYLIWILLCAEEHMKIETLSEIMCISARVISDELKYLEDIFRTYNLFLERKPHYGIRLLGNEFDKRKLCADYMVTPIRNEFENMEHQEKYVAIIGKIVLDIMYQYNVKFSEGSFQSIVYYIYISYIRCVHNKNIETATKNQNNDIKHSEYEMAKDLLQILKESGVEITQSENEIAYIAFYIAGRRIFGEEENKSVSPIVIENANKLSNIILNCLDRVYNLDFRDNLSVRIILYNHIIPFHIRLKYGIPMKNLILDEIKNNYPYSFSIAQRAMADVASEYGKDISEDEIGFFAIIIEMAIESTKKETIKKNVLIVCMTGKSSSQFLSFRFKKEFGKYVNRLEICSVHEFEKYDLRGIDYIFTTVPMKSKAGIPVYKIGDFLDENDLSRVRKKLELGNMSFLKKYYKKELFFPHIKGDTWEEVIREMCSKIAQNYPIPEKEFCESVIQREKFGHTDFGNNVAIPHPEECFVKESFVSVGILDTPIIWSTNKVQLVILDVIYESTSDEIQQLYQATSNLLASNELVEMVIFSRDYDSFMQMLIE